MQEVTQLLAVIFVIIVIGEKNNCLNTTTKRENLLPRLSKSFDGGDMFVCLIVLFSIAQCSVALNTKIDILNK